MFQSIFSHSLGEGNYSFNGFPQIHQKLFDSFAELESLNFSISSFVHDYFNSPPSPLEFINIKFSSPYTRIAIVISSDYREDTQKTSRSGTERLSPVSKKPAETTPTESFKLAIKAARNEIDLSLTGFEFSCNKLASENASFGQFAEILTVRKNFWKVHDQAALEAKDFNSFNALTQKQKNLDRFLVSLIEKELNLSNQKQPMRNYLGILSLIKDEETWDLLSDLSESAFEEIKEDLINVLLDAERQTNHPFLNSLAKFEKEFNSHGYASVAEHYQETIRQFQEIDKTLSLENVDNYVNEWNALLKEFDPQHQLFLKLLDAELALAEQFIEEDIDVIIDFLNERTLLENSSDTEAYIQKAYSVITKAKA